MSNISYFQPMDFQLPHTSLPDETVIRLTLPHGVIEVRHKGTYIEVHRTEGRSFTRLTMEPMASDELLVRVEREIRDKT